MEDTGSLLCVGLDSQLSALPTFLSKSNNPIWEFNRAIIDQTYSAACAFKPNLAFYLEDGMRGLDALYQTLDYIPEEIPVILDCKVGDIGNTMQSYVSAFFESMEVDAITFNPLMGSDVAKPILSSEFYFGFALALTSNPSAADFLQQDALAERIAQWIQNYPERQIGAVVGATQVVDLQKMRALLPGRLFLIPGVGAQGGDLKAVMDNTVDSPEHPNILINLSRGIIFKDGNITFAETAGKEALKLKNEIKALL